MAFSPGDDRAKHLPHFNELSPNLVTEGLGGGGLTLRSEDLDSVGEPYTEAAPASLGDLRELKIMASAALFERHPFKRTVR